MIRRDSIKAFQNNSPDEKINDMSSLVIGGFTPPPPLTLLFSPNCDTKDGGCLETVIFLLKFYMVDMADIDGIIDGPNNRAS